MDGVILCDEFFSCASCISMFEYVRVQIFRSFVAYQLVSCKNYGKMNGIGRFSLNCNLFLH